MCKEYEKELLMTLIQNQIALISVAKAFNNDKAAIKKAVFDASGVYVDFLHEENEEGLDIEEAAMIAVSTVAIVEGVHKKIDEQAAKKEDQKSAVIEITIGDEKRKIDVKEKDSSIMQMIKAIFEE